MTPPASTGRSPSGEPKRQGAGRPSPEPRPADVAQASSRRIAATLVGGVAGAVALAVLLMAGFLVYQRLSGTSTSVFFVVALVFGAGGIYAGWIAATMVFAALRGGD